MPLTRTDIKQPVDYVRRTNQPPTQNSNGESPLKSHPLKNRLRKNVALSIALGSVRSAAIRASRRCGIWLSMGAKSAANAIQEFWNSTILIQLKKPRESRDSSVTDMGGVLKHYDKKLGNVEFYVPTVTDDTPSPSRTSIPTPMPSTPLRKSPINTNEIIKKLRAGYISGISLEEYMQVSVLRIVMNDEEFILREDVPYGGSIYDIEMRIRNITLSTLPKKLREKQ